MQSRVFVPSDKTLRACKAMILGDARIARVGSSLRPVGVAVYALVENRMQRM